MSSPDLILSGTIGWTLPADYVRQFLASRKGSPVTIQICSLGGFVPDALEIYQAIREHGEVTCHFVGMSASAATFLAMSARHVLAARNSLLLIHNASVEADIYGCFNKEQLDGLAASLNFERSQLATIDDLIAKIYADRHGKAPADLLAAMKRGAWLTPEQALALGIIDTVGDEVETPPAAKPTNSLLSHLALPHLPQQETSPLAQLWEKVKRAFAEEAGSSTLPNLKPRDLTPHNLKPQNLTPMNKKPINFAALHNEEEELTVEKLTEQYAPEELAQMLIEAAAANAELQQKLADAEAAIEELKKQLAASEQQTEEARKEAEAAQAELEKKEAQNRALLHSAAPVPPAAPTAEVSSADLAQLLDF